jgi:hypothetical protein
MNHMNLDVVTPESPTTTYKLRSTLQREGTSSFSSSGNPVVQITPEKEKLFASGCANSASTPNKRTLTEEGIRVFAEDLYRKLIQNFNETESPFALIMQDDATFSECPGLTSANIRNVLLGGNSNGTATYEEFVQARAEYDASCIKATFSIQTGIGSNQQQSKLFEPAERLDVEKIIDHLTRSTSIIIQRLWSLKMQQKYLKKTTYHQNWEIFPKQ